MRKQGHNFQHCSSFQHLAAEMILTWVSNWHSSRFPVFQDRQLDTKHEIKKWKRKLEVLILASNY